MILIVDDDAGVRTSLSFLLKRAGFQVEAVAGPKEAIAAVRGLQPELVLMDMNFTLTTTGEEGLQLLRQVKAQTLAGLVQFLPRSAGHSDDRLGIDRFGGQGDAGGSLRFRHETLE